MIRAFWNCFIKFINYKIGVRGSIFASLFTISFSFLNDFWFLFIYGFWAMYADIRDMRPDFLPHLKMRFLEIFVEEFWGDLIEKQGLMKKTGKPSWVILLWTAYSYLSLISPQLLFKIKELFVYEKKVKK